VAKLMQIVHTAPLKHKHTHKHNQSVTKGKIMVRRAQQPFILYGWF